jgi:L-lactate dehydrogenase complex protein LldE
MRVQLLLTCLCDAFFGEVGIAAVKVLRHAGCEVSFPEGQTCCGQPPYNAGHWDEARRIARHTIDAFSSESPIVTPSSSCAAMLRHGAPRLGLEAPRVFELGEFLLSELGVARWPMRGSAVSKRQSVAYHRGWERPMSVCCGSFLGWSCVR